MLRLSFLLSFIFCAAIFEAPADAFLPRGTTTGCPYATDNGCAAAPINGSFKNTSLLTSAQQMGQNSLLPSHPMTFNVAGVDYPIGYDKTITLKDPRTINDSICQWAVTFLDCSSTGSGVVNEVLDGYDFSGTTIGQSAVGIWAPNNHVSAGSTLTITNSKFSLIPSTGAIISLGGNFTNLVYKSNQCDGASANSASGFCLDSGSVGAGTWDVEYNAFTNQGVGRIAGGLTNANFVVKYNYIAGLNSLNTSNHGELMLRNCSGGRANCTGLDDYEGNFIVWPPGTVAGVNNATIFPGDGNTDNVRLTAVTFDRNIVVTNSLTGGNAPINQAIFNASLANMGVVSISGNWIDASGSDDCSINGVKSGGNSVTAQQSGTVVTITGLSVSFNNNPIAPGWQFYRGGVLVATILSMGTSVGNTGTVNVDTSAAIGSDSAWTLVPGFTSFTATNNFGLADPSHTGTPVALGLSGPQFTAAHCPPHY